MKRLSYDQCVDLGVIMNFIRYTQTEKDMCIFFIFGLSALRPRDAVRPRLVWTYLYVATAYVRRKQLRIKGPVRAVLLLFFPKQSNKSLEKHCASKEATPREHQGKREKIGCIHRTRPSGTVSCHSRDSAAA